MHILPYNTGLKLYDAIAIETDKEYTTYMDKKRARADAEKNAIIEVKLKNMIANGCSHDDILKWLQVNKG